MRKPWYKEFVQEIIHWFHPLLLEISDPQSPTRTMWSRLRNATLAMMILLGFGTQGYYIIGQGEWTWFDSFYMTVVTISTVGFGEVIPIHHSLWGRPFTVVLLLSSMWINYYFISTLTTVFLGREFQELWWRRNMDQTTKKQSDHIIVCGAGETGIHVIRELLESSRGIVVIDDKIERIKHLQDLYRPFPAVVGDATEESILEKAGVHRAYGLVSLIPSDKDNLYITLSARRLNPRLKIVSKAIDLKAFDKLKSAGANQVVSPNFIGGIRIASEMVRPHVVQFLDLLTQHNELNLCIEEITIHDHSKYTHKSLSQTDLRERELLALAIYSPKDAHWLYNPPAQHVLEPLSTLLVLGNVKAVQSLRDELIP
ncbi:MAG: potassium channel protein, partial [Myxococcota bacterium]